MKVAIKNVMTKMTSFRNNYVKICSFKGVRLMTSNYVLQDQWICL